MCEIFFILGEINLRPETGALGAQVIKGNVYFDNQPVCDDEWGSQEARVACRWVTILVIIRIFHTLSDRK